MIDTGKYGELTTACYEAQGRLKNYASELLINSKFVMKNFDFDMGFFHDNYRHASQKLLQILAREFLKRNPIFRTTKVISQNSREFKISIELPPPILRRYLAIIRKKALLSRVSNIIYTSERFEVVQVYEGVPPQRRNVSLLVVNLHMACGEYRGENPYTIFQHLESLIQIMETMSKYARLTSPSGEHTQLAFYNNARGTRETS